MLLLPWLAFGQTSLVFDYGSDWKYWLGTREASTPDRTAWRRVDFPETGWVGARAPLGYANPPNSPAESSLVTVLPSGSSSNYVSLYLRKKFTLTDPRAATKLSLNINVDDGYIVWLNTNRIASYNAPAGDPLYTDTATSAIEPTLTGALLTNNVASLLRAGENILAIQVFNNSAGSSDLFFDAALSTDLDQTPPTIVDRSPAPDMVLAELPGIQVVFSENVQGVHASDLLINGIPATGLSVISPREYSFSFPAPPTGKVQVAWALAHGITDFATPPNPFAGGSWSYVLDPKSLYDNLRISEFMADNENGIRDEDGTRSDWIELVNTGTVAVNLGGCFLTDSTNNLARWRLPSMFLDPKRYLLVWASGKDRTNATGQLHTDFKLEKNGSYLALVSPSTNVISAFAPMYPAQRSDISYGRAVSDPAILGFFTTPTPGAQNTTTGAGFAPEPTFSREGGVYTNSSVQVTLATTAGQIRYTLDGSVPSSTSALYSGPITLSTSTTIKARVFQTGLLPSEVIAKSYFLVDNSVAGFSSKLPLMIFSTSGQPIADHVPSGYPRTFTSMLLVDSYRGLASPLGAPDYLGQAEIGIRGQTSSGFPKKPYRLELQDAYRNDRDAGLLGLPASSDWILNNPYTDKPFLQNFLAHELFEKMGHYAVRRRFVEVFVNQQGGRVSYPRDYAGVYLLLEKIKVGDDRVPITPLTPYDTAEPNISGGYMFKKDKDSSGDLDFYTPGGSGFSGQRLKLHEPAPTQITTPQFDWLVNHLTQFERALYASNWRTATGTNHYSWYIDVNSFVDYHWIVEFTKQIDGYRLSNYLYKDRNGKINMAPIWDWNLSFGNADYLDGATYNGWYYSLIGDNEHLWLRRLIAGSPDPAGTTGDPEFNQRIADRWSQLRSTVFDPTNLLMRISELTNLLNDAAVRDFQKWPRLGTYVWPNPSFYVTPTNYAGVIWAMKNWTLGRYNWIDRQYVVPPTFSVPGGRVPPALPLTISGSGSIYYTTTGLDPRAPGGGVAATAQLYSGPIPLSQNAQVVARSRVGTKWSGPTKSTYTVKPTLMLVTELMYHPAPPPVGSPFLQEDFEFIELMNAGDAPIDLEGYLFTSGVDFVFPKFVLNPAAKVLVVKNRAAFESLYGTGLPIAGEYLGQLENSGERLVLATRLGEVVIDFEYTDNWYPITDGAGFSLVLTDDGVSAASLGSASVWRAAGVLNGSPGRPKPAPPLLPVVVINEALTRPGSGGVSQVELQNLSSSPADIGGWFISDNFDRPRKFRIPAGTVILPGQFRVFNGNDFQQSLGALVPFALNPLGEEIYLFSGDATTNLTGYVHGFDYGTQKTNGTLGRVVDSQAHERFVTLSAATLGATNAAPLVPPVVMNEILYRPPDVVTNGAAWNNTEDEFIELFNRSDAAVPLYDTVYPTNVWELGGNVRFRFPLGTTLPAKGHLLVVNFNPQLNAAQLAAFRQKYQVGQTPVVGPYEGNLDNRQGSIALYQPEPPQPGGPVPQVALEQIHYSEDSGWPLGADGSGYSLSRIDASQFADEPLNWSASPPTAGRVNLAGAPPVILQGPTSQFLLASQTISLSVLAQGDPPLAYQWRWEEQVLPGATNATLVLTNAQPAQSGQYTVVVLGPSGSINAPAAMVWVGRDDDRDGMDDDWELDHGLNPFTPADAGQDLDGDGLTNASEFIAGTDPQNASSRLSLELVSAVGGQTTLRFHAAAFRSYTVLQADQLGVAAWTKLQDVPAQTTGRIATVLDQAAPQTRYYRLVSPAQP